jgi:hypothetical protein
MKKIIAKHRAYWSDKALLSAVFIGALFLVASLLFNHAASVYVDHSSGTYVQDIILDNLPVMNVDDILNEGVLIYSAFMIFLVIIKPKKIPFVLKSVALFIFIRAIFTTLTHMGPAPNQTYLDPDDLLARLSAGRDFFFSGHTGMPFLLALIFWKEDKFVCIVSLVASIVFGASVLLGHLHYSIDVFAAFFITYTIYHLAQKFFAKDFLSFNKKTE